MQSTDNDLIAAIFDTLVPPRPDRNLPGAGRPEVVAYVRERLAATPELVGLIDPGYAAAEQQAQERHGAAFSELDTGQRTEILRAVETAQPFFMPILLLQLYPGYYQQLDVLEAIGYPPRPPFPKGYDVDGSDETLLKKIRARVGRPPEP